jgi:hypothetical protein
VKRGLVHVTAFTSKKGCDQVDRVDKEVDSIWRSNARLFSSLSTLSSYILILFKRERRREGYIRYSARGDMADKVDMRGNKRLQLLRKAPVLPYSLAS